MGRQQPQVKEWEGLKVIHPNAAGLDIGSEEIWAAVAPAALPAACTQIWHVHAGFGDVGRSGWWRAG